MKGQIQARKSMQNSSPVSFHHEESLPNASAIFSFSALADSDDIVAAVRTAVVLAKSCGAALNVTILDEPLIDLEPDGFKLSSLESSLSAIKLKLLGARSMSHVHRFAMVANISAATFLTVGSITLQIHSADSYSQNHPR